MNCFGCCSSAETDDEIENEKASKKGKEKKHGANLASLVDSISFKSGTLTFIKT